ncbi:CRISPR-associated endonuclease Cas3'' [Candidatus Sumerlaeota bacterium]|nr:CRISPR-associated endonuclease Cas3'' [Candidatus Sumerlaeota bacterium]
MSECFAHSLPDRPVAEWQNLDEHLLKVAQSASRFAETFDSANWAWNAGWLHDLGKAAGEFQAYLRQQNGLELTDPDYDGIVTGGFNHSSAGAALACELFPGMPVQPLAYLVAGHHAGLTDYHTATAGNGALIKRIEEGKCHLPTIELAAAEVGAQMKPLQKPPAYVGTNGFHLWSRMLFSCLVDADYLDTEEFMQSEVSAHREGYPHLPELKERFDDYMRGLSSGAQPSSVNVIRREILEASRASAREKPGMFSMTVPTGGGKTLSAMAFALDHAVIHGQRRIIYVIPYTSIIEQTAAILAEIFGRMNVVEHHSNLDPDRETQRSRLASENWDAPIIVTTNVQFFESLFAARPSRCRKLHNLMNSVVILDEAQLLPPKWLDPCVDALNRLANAAAYKATIILSTATQPALPGLDSPREIVPNPGRFYEALKRVKIKMPEDLHKSISWDDLAAELAIQERVLCIVNTRRDCRDLHALMPQGTIHLSALMCGEHRSLVIAQIKSSLRSGHPVRVISTQLVEAGVDIDFPIVFRALAGLDSIIQAAGRCNREGMLQGPGVVRVFVPPKDTPRGLMRKGSDTTRELADPGADLQSPETSERYFGLFYSKVNDTGKQWLRDRFGDVTSLQFRTAEREFHFIDDQAQQSVIVLFGESEKWIKRLRFAGPTREIMRRLQRYTVNVSRHAADAMLLDGRLEKLDSGVVIQSMPGLYDDTFGLDIFRDHIPPEDLMV